MTQELKDRWIEALTTGNYPQTKNCLKDDSGFCCLGVLCDLIDPNGWEEADNHQYYWYETNPGDAPQVIRNSVENDTLRFKLIGMNDSGIPFSKIAQVIQDELSVEGIPDADPTKALFVRPDAATLIPNL